MVPIALAIVLLCTIAPANRPALAQGGEIDAAVRQLRMAVSHQRDGSHLRRLFALRRLTDATLRPFFYELVQHGEWQVQVHAALGLAEIADNKRIDPWLITQLKPAGQDSAIASALDLALMGEEEIRELLRWEGLLPMSRLLLAAELAVHHNDPPRDLLRKLHENPDLRIAALASALLMQVDEHAVFSAFRDRISTLPNDEVNRVVGWLAEVARQYKLNTIGGWLIEMLRSGKLDEHTTYLALFSALDLNIPDALDVLGTHIRDDMRISERVRLKLMLLTTAPAEPEWAFDRLAGSDALCLSLAEVGRAQARGRGERDAIEALIALGHPRSTEWAVEYAAQRMERDDGIAILNHIIDRYGHGERIPASAALAAVSELYRLAPQQVLDHLVAAEDDSSFQETLLLGLLDRHDARAAAAAGQLRRIGAGRADSLALLLIASEAETLTEIDMRRLGVIAAGGGRVAEGLQAQAAWLYLKLSNRIEPAMSRIFQ